jgi:hypothetical protein
MNDRVLSPSLLEEYCWLKVRVPICTMQNLRLESNLNYSTIGAIPENTLTLGAGIA